ncbi:MAG: type II secretion system secretin GspD [Deltaproteobacteria bacterium]|nr:type II secretion system secretin GspD [Deltaproteobacteria bacterium]
MGIIGSGRLLAGLIALLLAAQGLVPLPAAAQQRGRAAAQPVPGAPAPAEPPRGPMPGAPAPPTQPAQPLISLDFKDVDLQTVVKFFSELTRKNFILDEKVTGKVTILSPTRITVDEAYHVFESVLLFKGYTTVPVGKALKIIPIREARQSSLQTVTETAPPPPPSDSYMTRLVPLRNVAAGEMVGLLAPLVPRESSITAYPPTNTLIITDTGSNIERLLKIVSDLDVERYREQVEVIPLRYATAESVAKTVVTLLTQRQARMRVPPVPGAPAPPPLPAELTKVIPDQRTNALIVLGNQPTIQELRTLVERLDVEAPKGPSRINVYYLENADAESLAKVLVELTQRARARRAEEVARPPRPGPPAPPPLPPGVPRLPVPGAPPAPSPAAAPSPEEATERGLGELGEEIRITADKATNALIIVSSPQDYETLKEIIKKLDMRRRQVYVEAAIMEISLEKTKELGIEFRLPVSPTDTGTRITGGTDFGGISGAATNPFALSGLAVGILRGTFTFRGQEFLNIGALLRALQTEQDVNVLSTPHLLTSDNQEAEIVVGDNVPFITGQSLTTGGVSQTIIERKDVGLTLRLTPQINEGDHVKLTIAQEISALKDNPLLPATQVGPTTTKRAAKTTVVVRDQQTVVIGGLLRDDTTETEKKVPVLGDIPVLGWLFKSKEKRDTKTNLLIFLTPHIVREPTDIAQITEEKQRGMDAFSRERRAMVYGERGAIKRSRYQLLGNAAVNLP